MARREVVVETRNLSMHFGGVRAVDNVDFVLREKELRCLIGPNGAGKSTFFKCLTLFSNLPTTLLFEDKKSLAFFTNFPILPPIVANEDLKLPSELDTNDFASFFPKDFFFFRCKYVRFCRNDTSFALNFT